MLARGAIIKSEMARRGYKHRRTEDQFTVRGSYARHLQYVYAKEHKAKKGLVVDLVYFAVDIVEEKLVMGFFRENTGLESGVYINTSRSVPLAKFNAETIKWELDKLIPPSRDRI